jgi:hypothetical protein
MSESGSTHQASHSQRAARNPYKQATFDDSLARYLASRDLPVPGSLRRSVDLPLRSSKRAKHGEHERDPDVRSHYLIP